MKILKIFGVVAGIHVSVLILFFAIPGCSSTSKPAPTPAETVSKGDAPPTVTMPGATAPAPAFDTPPVVSAAGDGGVRFNPTRPGTPAAGALATEPVTGVTPATTYTVKSGDNLSTIAKKNHVTVADLTATNNLKVTAILREGQKLIIPGKSQAVTAAPRTATSPAVKAPEAALAKPGEELVKHVVKSGESLSMIAQRYGVKSADIAVANNISDPKKIRPGQELIIPGGSKNSKTKPAAADAAKSGPKPAPDAKPIFTVPEVDTTPRPVPEIPIIRVDDTPPAKNP